MPKLFLLNSLYHIGGLWVFLMNSHGDFFFFFFFFFGGGGGGGVDVCKGILLKKQVNFVICP